MLSGATDPGDVVTVAYLLTIVASTLGGRVVATGAAVLAIDDFWHRLSTDPHSVVPRLRAPAS